MYHNYFRSEGREQLPWIEEGELPGWVITAFTVLILIMLASGYMLFKELTYTDAKDNLHTYKPGGKRSKRRHHNKKN
jgi:hypothetical protein